MYLSKGLSKVLLRPYLSIDEWQELDVISSNAIDVKIIHRKPAPPLFILQGGEGCGRIFFELLDMLNTSSSENYPLVIGVDMFTSEELNIMTINLLSIVLQHDALRFVFYNRGIRNIDFLNVPSQVNKETSQCPIKFFSGISKQERYFNAMIELRNMLTQADEENAKIYKDILMNLTADNLGGSIDNIIRRKMNIFDNNIRRFLFPAVTQYRFSGKWGKLC